MSIKDVRFTRWLFILMLLGIVGCICVIGSYEVRCLLFTGVVLAMSVNCIDDLLAKLDKSGGVDKW